MKAKETAPDLSWFLKFSAGIEALEAMQFDKAEQELKAAVKIAEELRIGEFYINSLSALGDCQRMAGKYKEAEATISEVISFAQDYAKHDKSHLALGLGAMGQLFLEQHKTEQAVAYLERSVAVLRRMRQSLQPECLTVFFGLITCYIDNGELDKADKLSRYTLDLSKELLGTADSATLMAMTLCAAVATLSGKQTRADILNCQIRTLVRGEGGVQVSDTLGLMESLLRQLEQSGSVMTKPISICFGDEESVIFQNELQGLGAILKSTATEAPSDANNHAANTRNVKQRKTSVPASHQETRPASNASKAKKR